MVAPSPLTGGRPFDIVIDLRAEPAIDHEILPPGYFAPRGDESALSDAIEQATDLVGEFEKPRYFAYDPNICAHGASGIRGCTRCLDACPTGAIQSIASASKSIRFSARERACARAPARPVRSPTPILLPRGSSRRFAPRSSRIAAAGGHAPLLLYHDAEAGAELWARRADTAPESVIPWAVEEIGSIGMDAWAAGIAWGAHVVLLAPGGTPDGVRRELDTQIDVLHAILEAMGYERTLLAIAAG